MNDGWHIKGFVSQALTKVTAGLTAFDTVQQAIANAKTTTHQGIETNATSDDVTACQRQINRSTAAQTVIFDLFGLDQGQILPRPISPTGMSVANNPLPRTQGKTQPRLQGCAHRISKIQALNDGKRRLGTHLSNLADKAGSTWNQLIAINQTCPRPCRRTTGSPRSPVRGGAGCRRPGPGQSGPCR